MMAEIDTSDQPKVEEEPDRGDQPTDTEMIEEQIITIAMFSIEDIHEATE